MISPKRIIFLISLGYFFMHQGMAAALPDTHMPMPVVIEDAQNRAVVLFENMRWRVIRVFPSGYIELLQKDEKNRIWIHVDLDWEWRRRIHPMAIAANNANDLFIASYDVIDNLPSGRSLTTVSDSIDLWRIDATPASQPRKVIGGLQLGGIDTLVYMHFSGNSLHLCGDNHCYSWKSGRNASQWSLGALADYEFVEVSFEGNQAAALIRRKHDDRTHGTLTPEYSRYHLAVMNIEEVEISPVQNDGIPWNVRWENGKPTYRMASQEEDLRHVFYFDFSRMPFLGAMGIGSNNFEGRIAWAQAYYLNGLISIAEGSVQPLFSTADPAIRQRIQQEVQLIADLCHSHYPGYAYKRYALDRELLDSVVHLGRIASLLLRAQAGSDFVLDRTCAKKLQDKLTLLSNTLEEQINVSVHGKQFPYLRFRKNMPFWADGSTVPYNYVSAYVEGALYLNAGAPIREPLAGMLSVLLQQEFSSNYPDTWRYAGNLFDDGWRREDGISLNTPHYDGNRKALAHISYRVMDARAILKLEQSKPGSIDARLLEHFRELTRTGWLLPSMNEAFAKSPEGIGSLSVDVARRHARASAPLEIQSSIWALNQLAKNAAE